MTYELTPTWNIISAMTFYRTFRSWFKDHGYILCLYGSVLDKDEVKDLDVMLVPWRPNATSPETVFQIFCRDFHKCPVNTEPYDGLMNTWAHGCIDAFGRVIDFQFRKSDVTFEDLSKKAIADCGFDSVRR